MIFISMVLHFASLLNKGLEQLGNGLFLTVQPRISVLLSRRYTKCCKS